MPEIPGINPWTINLLNNPSGITSPNRFEIHIKMPSIQSIGKAAKLNNA
ncbi:MAG: hypothetical protein IPN09_08565 [Bacteroidetes bacterium]|nr:hypothetical protein [Bacteroidota bacterium]